VRTAAGLGAALLLSSFAAGQSNSAGERETYLREANVVDRRVIATGITLPQVVQLERGGERRRAVFKSLEVVLERQSVTVGAETQQGLRDSWKFEVAAYELDRLLGFGMVPVTIARKLGDQEGALIDWVDGVLPEFETPSSEFRLAEWENEVDRVWLFDYLAYNIDRTPDNLLVAEGFKVHLIDHSRAFQRFVVPMRPLSRFPRGVVERLRRLGADDFERALGDYLTRDELSALLERRKRVLETVDGLLGTLPEGQVLF
jgi:hypothetical protein